MTTPSEQEILYQLILEGPKTGNPDALRSLRAALINELALGSEQARFFLEHTPVTIKESANEEELLPQLRALQACGAQALIARSVIMKKREKKLADLTERLSQPSLSFREKEKSDPSPEIPVTTSNTKPTCGKPISSWKRYRNWIHQRDILFRKMLNEEMIIGTLISCFLTILVCGILIPLELYTRTRYWDNERRIRGFVNSYADVVFYGHLPKIK